MFQAERFLPRHTTMIFLRVMVLLEVLLKVLTSEAATVHHRDTYGIL